MEFIVLCIAAHLLAGTTSGIRSLLIASSLAVAVPTFCKRALGTKRCKRILRVAMVAASANKTVSQGLVSRAVDVHTIHDPRQNDMPSQNSNRNLC
jgi:hypothetical protein